MRVARLPISCFVLLLIDTRSVGPDGVLSDGHNMLEFFIGLAQMLHKRKDFVSVL